MKLNHLIELIILSALWGASFLFMRLGAPEFGPVALIELRSATAALFLLPFLIWMGKSAQLAPNVWPLLTFGVISTAIPFCLLSWATLYVSAGYASILNATAPIFTAIIAWLWVSERLSTSGFFGLLVGFIGVFVLVFDKQGNTAELTLLPIAAGLAATLCYGFGTNFTKQKMSNIDPLVIACGSQIGAAFSLLPFSIWLWPEQNPNGSAWLGAIILGIACTGIAFILFFRLIKNVGPNKAITVTYLIPLFSMIWGMIFLGESVTLYMAFGGLLILLGVALTTGVFNLKKQKA